MASDQHALIRPIDAATRLGFDTTKKNWRIGFWRFVRRQRIQFIRLSARRLRFNPEALDQYIQAHTVGRQVRTNVLTR